MKIRAVLFILLMVLPGPARAQVIMRSGDHEGFSRLVAAVGENVSWRTNRHDRRVRIDFLPGAPVFDLTHLFDRISRDRVATIHETLTGLEIDLSCDCEVTFDRYQGRFLVIDISDNAAPSGANFDPAPIALPLFLGAEPIPSSQNLMASPPADPVPHEPDRSGPDTQYTSLDASGALLAEQIARATAAGLLDPASSVSPQPPMTLGATDHGHPVGTPVLPDSHIPSLNQEAEAPELPLPVTARNAFDLNQGSAPGRLVVSADTGNSCLAPPHRGIDQWIGDVSFLNGLGTLRGRLFDDRDHLDQSVALELAELYLVHGFAAEARYWLERTDNPPAFHLALAAFLDSGTLGVFGAFEDYELCAPDLHIWMFLSTAPTPHLSVEATDEILADYYELPPSLKDLIGAELARSLLRAEQRGAALEVREILARGGRIGNHDLAFLDRDLGIENSSDDSALQPANAGASRAEIALAGRILDSISQSGHASNEDLLAADALIRENEPPLTPNGLRYAAALGHALAGEVDMALTQIEPHGQRDIEAQGSIFADMLTTVMAQEQTTSLILLLSSDRFGQFGPFPNASFRRRVAGYVLDHGLPGLARDIILAGGGNQARDRDLLTQTMARLTRDRQDTNPDPVAPSNSSPPQPADSASATVALLEESRSLRADVQALLLQGSPPLSN